MSVCQTMLNDTFSIKQQEIIVNKNIYQKDTKE